MYKEMMSKITAGQDLSEAEIFELIGTIHSGNVTDVQIAGFQVALLMKGASLAEITSIAKAMRQNCVPIKPRVSAELMDTCGTGGGRSTFNISTAAAVVAAAAGIPVAKHGSRSICGLSGNADVMEALGVKIDLSSAQVEKLIEEIGIAFICASFFHPVMSKLLPPEAELGIKTIFHSMIGPLINPAFAPRHLLGVYKPELLETVPQVAMELGYTRAMFIHGVDGLDEISLVGATQIVELQNGEISRYEICPEDFGLKRCTLEEIMTGTPRENADVILGTFRNQITGPRRDAIVFNAAGALMVGGKAETFGEGIALASKLIDSGEALTKLVQLRMLSHAV